MCYPPGIVNQGRRSTGPKHCHKFRHRQPRNVGSALHILEAFIGRIKPIFLSHVLNIFPCSLMTLGAFFFGTGGGDLA